MHLRILAGDEARARDLASQLPPEVTCRLLPPAGPLSDIEPDESVLVDIDLGNSWVTAELRDGLRALRRARRVLAFAIDGASRAQHAAASSMGATHILSRPLSAGKLLDLFREASQPALARIGLPPEIQASFETNGAMLARLLNGGQAPQGTRLQVETATDETIEAIAQAGLATWIEAVKCHHDATFRHCLQVNGLAIAFARTLGFSRADIRRLGVASAVHDIGKARVPVRILDKQGRLSPEEIDIVKLHPRWGADILGEAAEFEPEVVDAVLHHHEMLNGSGYPDGICGREIGDLTRLVTIVDIFSALLEERAYKPSFPPEKAFEMMLGMGDRLDGPLVRAFRPIVEALQAAMVGRAAS
ncbi:HD domain-containing protein [Alsobacter sp. SYSU M60028]|uniref:HD domain-containing protein n=1 Tax=Alsobacter ponti TaxID=2962936 RepID=A0ABT1L9B1_9HYPH|nr:HD domain-containing phosphohydrolase [Alsobacter ponti]MCP8938082.1 HD domain-containing protein [Alsobacter ponti]